MSRLTSSTLLATSLFLAATGCASNLDGAPGSFARASSGIVDLQQHVSEGAVYAEDAWTERGALRLSVNGGAPHDLCYEITSRVTRGLDDLEVVIADETAGLTVATSIDDEAATADLGLLDGDSVTIGIEPDDETVTIGGVAYADVDEATDALLQTVEAQDINAELYAGMLEVLETSEVTEDTARFRRRSRNVVIGGVVDCAILNAALGIPVRCR
ncbi:MAG: hypothetical protein ABIO70_03695 [Pseudomonadota bacterium]